MNDNINFTRELARFRTLTNEVRRRLVLREALDAFMTNLALTLGAAFIFAVVAIRLGRFSVSPWTFLFATLGIAVAATVASLLTMSRDKHAPEKAIDAFYRLEDRCLTASELLKDAETRATSPVEALQLQDCFERVKTAKAKDVVAIRVRRAQSRISILVLLAILFALAVWRPFEADVLANAPNATAFEVATEVRESILPEIERIALENSDNADLQALKTKLQNLSTELTNSTDDPKKGVALVAQMEQEIQNAIAASGIEATDSTLKELGNALSGIDQTQNIARAFAEGGYETAADNLEKLDFEKMSARDRQTLAEKLRAAAAIIRSRKDEQTAQLTEQLADELQAGKCASCKNTACKLADKARAQKKNKESAKQLDCQMARLGLCKSNCAGACGSCAQNSANQQSGGKNGGQDAVKSQDANSNAQSAQKGSNHSGAKSLESSTASDPLSGKDVKLDSERNLTQLTGSENEKGDSQVERLSTTDSTVSIETVRERDDANREYEKQLEAALDDDNIPLERRRIARDYFDALRTSQNTEEGEAE